MSKGNDFVCARIKPGLAKQLDTLCQVLKLPRSEIVRLGITAMAMLENIDEYGEYHPERFVTDDETLTER